MLTYFSPSGNPEIWDKKPAGYSTVEEWEATHPAPVYEPTENEKTLAAYHTELHETEAWLAAHDYIGVKIATGRATADNYAAEIATMTEYASRVEELRTLIAELESK